MKKTKWLCTIVAMLLVLSLLLTGCSNAVDDLEDKVNDNAVNASAWPL